MSVEVRGQQVADARRIAVPVRSVGGISLLVCLVVLVTATVLLAAGARTRHRTLTQAGIVAVWGASAAALTSGAMLLSGLLIGDTSFLYVVQNWDPDLAVPYRIAGLWAGPQGSLLFWAILLLGAASAVAAAAWRPPARPVERPRTGGGGAATDRSAHAPAAPGGLQVGAAAVLCGVAVFLVALLVGDPGSDPFAAGPGPSAQPAGLDPLLIHPAMALHPPALFLGYVGLAVPFAYAVAALATGHLQTSWADRSRTWALAGWVFLSLGIGLGAWWAYVILSWGGYWGWDPVENASLVPWLTATALLHALTAYRSTPALRRWSFALALLTFWCTVVAAWTTRTGVVASVHAFDRRTILLVVLTALLGVVAVAGGVLLARRWRSLSRGRPCEGGGSRMLARELLAIALVLFAGAVLFATIVVPLLFGQTVRPQTYEILARPLGVAVVLGTGICALLGARRRSAGGGPSWGRLWLAPVAAGAGTAISLATGGAAGSALGLVGLSACAFTATATLLWLARAWLRSREVTQEAWPAFIGLLRGRTLGAVVVHLGLALTVTGLIGADIYVERQRLELAPAAGASAALGEYQFTLTGARVTEAPQSGERIAVELEVRRDGRSLGTVAPALDSYDDGQTVPRADILGSAWRDVFVSPLAFSEEVIVVEAIVFPLVRFIWVGTGLLVVGGLIGLWPRRAGRRRADGDDATTDGKV